MAAANGVDQLDIDAYPTRRPPCTAFQQVAYAEFTRCATDIHRFAFVGKGRVAGDYEQSSISREISDQIFGQAVSEWLVLRVSAHVGEGQHGNRGLGRKSQGLLLHPGRFSNQS